MEGEPKILGEFLKNRKNTFAWSYVDMVGIDPNIAIHHLAVHLDAKPIRQKLIKVHPQIALLVKMELQNLLDVGFNQPIDYSK
jgi:hypothetical protein